MRHDLGVLTGLPIVFPLPHASCLTMRVLAGFPALADFARLRRGSTRFSIIRIHLPRVLAVSLLMLGVSMAQNARILEIENIVETATGANSQWVKATQNQSLAIGNRIRTQQRSRAAVALTGLYTVRLDEFTTLEITPALVDSEKPKLDLLGGAAFFFSRERDEEIDVQTPSVNAAMEGTQLFVQVLPGGKSIFQVLEGRVKLENASGQLLLESGQAGEAIPGQAPRRTAVIEAKNLLQWALYYPAVLDPNDLGMAGAASPSLAAYRKGNLLGALQYLPVEAPGDADRRIYSAGVLLAVGRLDESRQLLSGIPQNHPGRRALDRMIAAVRFQKADEWRLDEITTASEAMAESYYLQSRATLDPGNLEQARITALRATALAPNNGFAWTRLAELEFSAGHTKAARTAIEKGLVLTPENARTHALRGFILSSENRIDEARAAFETSVRLDGGFGNGWLGLGLTKIKNGDLRAGRADLQTAATVEPKSSVFHSYLAKAMSQEGRNKEAEKDLNLARHLDQNDPTPLLYSALIHQEQYKPNLAIGEMEESIALNDNRRLYRSALLLDQDRAVRGANLAKLYQYNGMKEVAVREATRAVESDYTNPSAHLFLANSFDALRDPNRILLRYETPWFNELLLSNLLSPVGGGQLSQYVSQQEYSNLLEADGVGGSFTSQWRSNSELRSTASVFGTSGPLSYGIDAAYYDHQQDATSSATARTEINAQFKWQVTPDDIFYFLGTGQDEKIGYDHPADFAPQARDTQEPGQLLAGWNHRWGPGSNTLFLGGCLSAEQTQSDPNSKQNLLTRDAAALDPSLARALQAFGAISGDTSSGFIYSPELLRAASLVLGNGGSGQVTDVTNPVFDYFTRRQFEIYTAELQHIQQEEQNTFLAGARWQGGRFETDASLNIEQPQFYGAIQAQAKQHSVVDSQRASLYAYDYWTPVSWLTVIGGFGWDGLDHPDNFRYPPVNDQQREETQISGKFGFTMTPSPWIHLRGAYTEGLGGITFDESVRLEPSQVAGFNQAYRTIISELLVGSVEAPRFKTWGLGLDGTLPSRTWWSTTFKVIEQDVDRTVGVFSGYNVSGIRVDYFSDGTPQRLAYREWSWDATLNQLVGDEFAVGLTYQITHSSLQTTLPELPPNNPVIGPDYTDHAILQQLSLFGNWNSPTGWFARLEANAYHQNLNNDPRGPDSGKIPDSAFWQFNTMVGYRFWRNQAEISAGILNIGDSDYQLSTLNPYDDMVHGRTAVISCRFSF